MGRKHPDTEEVLDIAVIGAGPCGLAVGVAAKSAGLAYALFDRGNVAHSLVGFPFGMTFFSTAEKLEIGGLPFVCSGEKPTREDALKYYRRVAQHHELEIRAYTEVLDVQGERGDFTLSTRKRSGEEITHRARHVVVATGNFDTPNLLDVPGEELPKVAHYYREAHPYFDQDCLVIGGGNSAVEAALDLHRAGARVTMAHFLSEFDSGLKSWVRPDIENRIKEGSIPARFRTRVAEIGPDYVMLRSEENGSTNRLDNDWVFALTGYTLDIPFLHQIGLEIDAETGVPQFDSQTMETNVPGIYVAGVIIAGLNANKIFIENGRFHGERIVEALS